LKVVCLHDLFFIADAGGFFQDPAPELLLRWYQTAAFTPFMRAHAHVDTQRREPWLFGEPWTSLIRKAIEMRYMLLPYWYTQFYESSMSGVPVMRPLFFEHPNDVSSFSVDNQFYVGPSLLVHPIVKPEASNVSVYFPANEVTFLFHINQMLIQQSRHGMSFTTIAKWMLPLDMFLSKLVWKRSLSLSEVAVFCLCRCVFVALLT
jgi:mannosyl-oligosaccharide alpha-1,3-glucosidase